MSHEVSNPYDGLPIKTIPSEPVVKKLLGEPGVSLFRRARRNERLREMRKLDEDIVQPAELSQAERILKEQRTLRAGEFVLKLPLDRISPSAEQLAEQTTLVEIHFDEILQQPYESMGFTEAVFADLGIADPVLRTSLLAVDQCSDGAVIAKVIDVDELAKGEFRDGQALSILSPQEFLHMMDQRGYRPATFKELLAYAKTRWSPEGEAGLTDEECDEQLATSQYMFSLGSFVLAGGCICAPVIGYHGGKRYLGCSSANVRVRVGDNFQYLFVRK